MSRTVALLPARRAVLGSALAALLVVAMAGPTAAWRSATPSATVVDPAATPTAAPITLTAPAAPVVVARPVPPATVARPGKAHHLRPADPAGAPVDTRRAALAAGGRPAPGGRASTVVRYGIDVSHWQGRIDWDKVARSGVQFVIAKATEGTWLADRWYARNRHLAQRAGLHFTAYHYANPSTTPGDARREADWFLGHAKLRGRNLVPALDLEEDGGLTSAQLERWTFQWVRRIEHKLGVKPIIYTSPGFWAGWVDDSPDLSRAGFHLLWLSHWQIPTPSVPGSDWGGEGWTFWQWTDRGQVAGITGDVDRNVYSGPRLDQITIREVRAQATDGPVKPGRPPRPLPR